MSELSLPNLNVGELDNATTRYADLTTEVSSSCDLMGTIQSMTNKITQSIRDEITGVVTKVQRAASDVVGEIKDKLSSMFSGSGETLNKIKGYMNKAKEFMSRISQKWANLSNEIRNQIINVTNKIKGAIQTVSQKITNAMNKVMGAINKVKQMVSNCVKGIAQATCSAINTALAGTGADALSNITDGATDSTLVNLKANKDVFNAGGSSLGDVTSNLAEANGVGDITANAAGDTDSSIASVSAAGQEATSIEADLASLAALAA